MFCTSLRRRPSFASTVSSLTSPSGLALKESQLRTHDVALPLPVPITSDPSPKPRRILRLLLLSPGSISEPRLPATLSRIQHFASLTGGVDIAMILALASPRPPNPAKTVTTAPPDSQIDGLSSYARLQFEIMYSTDLPWIPILPLATMDALAELIRSHAQAINRASPGVVPATSAVDLLSHCTTDDILPPLAVSLTTDLFPNLAQLACAGAAHGAPSTESGPWYSSDETHETGESRAALDVLKEQLSEQVVGGMLEFWADDWVID